MKLPRLIVLECDDPSTQNKCPEFHFHPDRVLVKDDYGNTCRFDLKQWEAIIKKVQDGGLKA